MSGYPHGPPNYGGYGSQPPPGPSPYASPPQPYGAPSAPYAAPSAPYGAPSAPSAPSPYHIPFNHSKPQSPSSGYSQPPPSGYSQPPPSGYPPPPSSGYSQPPSSGYSQPYSQQPPTSGYTAPPPSVYSQPPSSGYSQRPSSGYGQQPSGYSQSPSGYPPSSSGYPPQSAAAAFPPGTDPNVIACFQVADQDGSGFIDDIELQRALSSYNQSFSIRTVHLLMYLFTNSSVKKIGPKEFTAVFYSLQNWRVIFERFDRDRSGKIDQSELREALLSLGFAVSPAVLDLLVSKFDKSGGRNKAIEYDNFIECCLTVKGLTEKFREKDSSYSGSATFNYESFMMTVLPFLIA